MCGIVGAVSDRNVVPMLLAGLARLEYRGYDSSGIALNGNQQLDRIRVAGRVADLAARCENSNGTSGIAHTRWATHGIPSEANAHPHQGGDSIMVVHNGIIENHAELKLELQAAGYVFSSETDTEAIAHLIHFEYQRSAAQICKPQFKRRYHAYAAPLRLVSVVFTNPTYSSAHVKVAL